MSPTNILYLILVFVSIYCLIYVYSVIQQEKERRKNSLSVKELLQNYADKKAQEIELETIGIKLIRVDHKNIDKYHLTYEQKYAFDRHGVVMVYSSQKVYEHENEKRKVILSTFMDTME